MIKNRKSIPIKRVLLVVFIFAMLLSVTGVEYHVFNDWLSSSGRLADIIADEINERLCERIDSVNIHDQTDESVINVFLEDSVGKYGGSAVIFEKSTGSLVAGFISAAGFEALPDEPQQRNSAEELGNSDIHKAYMKYIEDNDPGFIYKGDSGKLHVRVREISTSGIDWIVMSAIPAKLYMSDIIGSIQMTAAVAAAILLLSLIAFYLIVGALFKPMDELLRVSASLSSGGLSVRAEVHRNDELGVISESLNTVADRMQFQINSLEENVRSRTEELHKANKALEENTNRLQLILDSAAEAIYGFDLDGRCTFCNISCVKTLGYDRQEDLLGRNMHHQVHHSRIDGTQVPLEECRIIQAIRQGKGFTADDEVFWRADGTSFNVEYHAFPQIKDGRVIGGVITFMDITKRKRWEEKIRYQSYHDIITGLYNRRSLEENLDKIDITENLPVSVIFADINGLKMTNDVFGHSAGDELIKKSAEILVGACEGDSIIARFGGDEFVILLPKTGREDAEKILARIRSEFKNARIEAIKCSISLGTDTKNCVEQSLKAVMDNAENAMYKDKLMNRKSENKEMIYSIIETLHSKSAREKEHSLAVGELCGEVGAVMCLPEPEINRLKRAGYLHDIGKIILGGKVLPKEDLTEHEQEKRRLHPAVGFRILNLFDDTLDLAEYVYGHHEKWDGSGYPRGLRGEQIPLGSRIISIVETYERNLSRGDLPAEERKKKAAEVIRLGSGKRFDPKIAELFLQVIERKEDPTTQNPASLQNSHTDVR